MSLTLPVLEKHGLNPVRPEFLDSSILSDFVRCPSYFYLRHVLGLVRRNRDPTETSSMDWGTCWHHCLEAYNSSGFDLAAGLTAIEEHYPTHIRPDTDRYKRSKERMIEGFFAYVKKWKDLDKSMDFIRHEQHFSVYIEDIGLDWSGRIDSVRRQKGKIRPWDYKSTSSMGSSYFDQFELSFQFPGYVIATEHITGQPINEITLDVFYTISRTQDFFRRTFRYEDADLREWKHNVRIWSDRLEYLLDNHLYEPEMWPKSWGMCAWWYGRKCPFFELHNISPIDDTRLLILEQDFEERRWNPIAEESDT
jgi:hypothetical protein